MTNDVMANAEMRSSCRRTLQSSGDLFASRVRFLFSFVALLVSATTFVSAQGEAPTFEGRLLNGTDMFRSAGLDGVTKDGFSDSVQPIPIVNKSFVLYLKSGKGSVPLARGRTDADGKFSVPLGAPSQLPVAAKIVASVEEGGLYSSFVTPEKDGPTDFRLYNTAAEDSQYLNGVLDVLLTLDDDPSSTGKLLRCRLVLQIGNLSGDLNTGYPFTAVDGRLHRAILRVPLPDGVRDLTGTGVAVHDNSPVEGWTFTTDGWAIIDSPLSPFPDVPQGYIYRLDYRVPARQESAVVLPVDFPLRAVRVRGIHEVMKLITPQLEGETTLPEVDPNDGQRKTWEVHYARDVQPTTLTVGITIDSMTLGEVSVRSLKVVGGFVLGALIAVILGLVLARSGPRVETLLSEATGEEIIERIAQLDAQFESGKIEKKDYRDTRERLISLARYEVPELTAEASGAGSAEPQSSGDSAGASSLPAPAQEILDRIREIEDEGDQDPRKIQERVLLLEELVRSLRRASGKTPVPTEDSEGSR